MLHPHPDWPKTLEEFRAWHERQPEVWEFIHGTPKLMAPGSKAHTLIESNAHVGAGPGSARHRLPGSGRRRDRRGGRLVVDPRRGRDLQ
jgi:hypothetical protein